MNCGLAPGAPAPPHSQHVRQGPTRWKDLAAQLLAASHTAGSLHMIRNHNLTDLHQSQSNVIAMAELCKAFP